MTNLATKKEITDEERVVLQIKFEDGTKLYCNTISYRAVADPVFATRYAPLDNEHPNRVEGRAKDKRWMESSFEAEISFVSFLEACKEYKERNDSS